MLGNANNTIMEISIVEGEAGGGGMVQESNTHHN